VQLERLRDELLSPDGQPRLVASHPLRSPLALGLTEAEQQLLEAYQHKVAAWGWRWQAGGGGTAGPLLTHVPLLWGSTLSATDLKVRVVWVMQMGSCRGAVGTLSKTKLSIAAMDECQSCRELSITPTGQRLP